MRLLFSLLLPFAFGACLATSLRAQEVEVKQAQPADLGVINDVDVTVTDLTEEKLSNPPKREIKFELTKEPLKRKLTVPDPKLFEQKLEATFDLKIPDEAHGYASISLVQSDLTLSRLAQLDSRYLVMPANSPSQNTASESFARMIKALPTDDSPAKEEREFLTNPQSLRAILNFRHLTAQQNSSGKDVWRFTLLATNPEQAELRSRALLTILDQGACRPIQLAIFKRREPLCVQVRDQRRARESAQRMMNVVQDELKSYVDFTPDMLPNLRVQQLQLDVDLAGVKARIAACDRLLAGTALKPERRSQVEDLKVAAEIEFSGFEARLTKSNEIIGKVKNKVDLLSKLSTAQKATQRAGGTVQGLEAQIKSIDVAIHAYAPLPLVDNKITIQPLEWTQ